MAKLKFSERLFLGVLMVALIILTAVFTRQNGSGSSHYRLNVVVPFGLIAIFITFYLFREFNRVRKAKRENRREYMNARRQELLDNLLKKNKKPTSDVK